VAITEGAHDVAVYSMVDRRCPPNLLRLKIGPTAAHHALRDEAG
jgi:hypothetical protein